MSHISDYIMYSRSTVGISHLKKWHRRYNEILEGWSGIKE